MASIKSRQTRIDKELSDIIEEVKVNEDLDSFRQASRRVARMLKANKLRRENVKF